MGIARSNADGGIVKFTEIAFSAEDGLIRSSIHGRVGTQAEGVDRAAQQEGATAFQLSFRKIVGCPDGVFIFIEQINSIDAGVPYTDVGALWVGYVDGNGFVRVGAVEAVIVLGEQVQPKVLAQDVGLQISIDRAPVQKLTAGIRLNGSGNFHPDLKNV